MGLMMERDYQLLKYLEKLKFCNTHQLEKLIPYKGKTQAGIVVRRRMLHLVKAGLVKAFRTDMYSPNVYQLTEKGAELTQNYFGFDEVKVYRRSSHLEHYLKVNDYYVALYELRKEGYRIVRININSEVFKGFKPDIFFNLEKGNQRKLGFVEVDMGTESIDKHIVKGKALDYQSLFESGHYQDKYKVFPMVYFLTRSKERAENMKVKLDKAGFTFPYKVNTFETLEGILKLIEGV